MNTKILFAVSIILVFISCQKELSIQDPDVPVITSSSKVKTYTEDITSGGTHTVVTFNLTYDTGNKLISIISASSPGDRFEFKYSSDSYTLDLYNSNALSIHELFFLNSNSMVDSTIQYNDTNDSGTEKYLYNSAKQLIVLKEYEYSVVTGAVLFNMTNYVYDNNGDVIKASDNNSVITYDYYPGLINNLAFLTPYLPVNKNLVKTTINNSGGTIITLNHTYTFDSGNRLTTEKMIADNGDIGIRTFTYY